MAAIQSTVSTASLTSIQSKGSLKGKKKKNKVKSVTVDFQFHWLESTLSFVKDDSRLSLNYGVTQAQAIFIRDVLNFEEKRKMRDLMYAPLYEALKIYGLKYNFKLSRINNEVMVLQKLHKYSEQVKEHYYTKTGKVNPKIVREKTVIDRLSQKIMVDIAHSILDFMEDNTRASLEFTKVKPLESMFMQSVMNASRPMFAEHKQMLASIKNMKKKIDFTVNISVGKVDKNTNERTVTFKKVPKFIAIDRRNHDPSLYISNISHKTHSPSTKYSPKLKQIKHKQNSVQNEKIPMQFVQSSPQNNLMVSIQNVKQKANSTHIERNSMSVERISTHSMQFEHNSPRNIHISVQNETQKSKSTDIVWIPKEIIKNSTSFEPNSMQFEPVVQKMDEDSSRSSNSSLLLSSLCRIIPKTDDETVKCVTQAVEDTLGIENLRSQSSPELKRSHRTINKQKEIERGRLDKRKIKLLEDMSMPVRLDKPERIMQKMGWDGGPLGCRGVGLTEPIIPPLELVQGAGLGHVKNKISDRPSKLDKPSRADKSSNPDNLPKLVKLSLPDTPSIPDTVKASIPAQSSILDTVKPSIPDKLLKLDSVHLSAPDKPSILDNVQSSIPAKPSILDKVQPSIPAKPSILDKVQPSIPAKPSKLYTGNHSIPDKPSKLDTVNHTIPDKPSEPEKVNYPKPENRSKKVVNLKFRLELLFAILDLIQTDKQTTKLVYDKKLKKKDIGFVRYALKSFSERKKVTLNHISDSSISELVSTALKKFPDVVIHGTVSECKKQVTLKKRTLIIPKQTETEPTGTHIIPKKTGLEPTPPQAGVITDKHLSRIADTIVVYKEKSLEEKKYIGIRVTLLIEILHLLKTKNLLKQLYFEFPLAVQFINYIAKAVERLNMGKRPYVCAQTVEQSTCDEILRLMGDVILVVNFDDRKMGVLIEKRLPEHMTDYNLSLVNALQCLDVANHYTNYVFVPYSNLVVSYKRIIDLPTIDLTTNDKSNSIDNLSNGVKSNNNDTQVLNGDANGIDTNQTNVIDSVFNYNNVPESVDVPESNETNFGEPQIEGWNTNVISGASIEDNKSEDDFVIIEAELETISISDDESTDTDSECSQNTEIEIKLVSSVEKIGLERKITNLEGNFVFDENKSEGDIDVLSQISNDECQGRENENITEMDATKSLNSLEFEVLDSESYLTSDIVTCEGSVDTTRSEEFNDTARESIDTETIVISIEEARNEESLVILKSVDCADISIKGKTDQDEEIKADIDKDKDVTKISPKKRLNSKEFDRDLYDLAVVLNLDKELFDNKEVIDKINTDNASKNIVKKVDTEKLKAKSRSDSEQFTPDNSKKTKVFTFDKFKNLLLVPKDYPCVQLKKECAIKIQTILSDAIDKCTQLPLLKCHGIQDGGLLYSCHDELSVFFIENCLSVASDYKIINDVIIKKNSHKMKIRVYSLLDDIKKLFKRLMLYNAGLFTDSWNVKDIRRSDDYMLISVELDDYSFKYICDNNYCLYAGIDEVWFAVVWD